MTTPLLDRIEARRSGREMPSPKEPVTPAPTRAPEPEWMRRRREVGLPAKEMLP